MQKPKRNNIYVTYVMAATKLLFSVWPWIDVVFKLNISVLSLDEINEKGVPLILEMLNDRKHSRYENGQACALYDLKE